MPIVIPRGTLRGVDTGGAGVDAAGGSPCFLYLVTLSLIALVF